MPILNELQMEYNSTLEREGKAFRYFNDKGIPFEEKEKHFDEYRKIVKRLNELLTLLPHSDYNISSGFGIEQELFAA